MLASGVSAEEEPGERLPVIFDCDLGTGIDDAFALALILASPELELRGVTTVGTGAEDRAWMVCRFLTHAGHADVPVAWGRDAEVGPPIDWQIQYRRHPAVVWDRTAKPVEESAVELMYRLLKEEKGKVTIIAAGPLTNVAKLIEQHPDARPWVKQVVIAEGYERHNITADKVAAEAIFRAGISQATVPGNEQTFIELPEAQRERLFAASTPLTFQVQALYELWGEPDPTLHSTFAVAWTLIANDRSRQGEMTLDWFVARISSVGQKALPRPPANESALVKDHRLPSRVHVIENYETDIEKRWWLSGVLETKDLPATGGRRACRAVVTQDYDDLMGDANAFYRAVVFNPVPGPPMGPNTRLRFRYKLRSTDTLRVQLYSLSNGYHRYLSLKGLPQDNWQEAVVDMTQMRRPDGSGGALAADERIDDIQFYIDPRGELLIDDIILYNAAPDDQKRPFPRSIVFTGWFDTGKQGAEWPGEFEIVEHDPPLTWKAARAVPMNDGSGVQIRVSMRGQRPLPKKCRLRCRYQLTGNERVMVEIVNSEPKKSIPATAAALASEEWAEATFDFEIPAGEGATTADEIVFSAGKGAALLVDDLLLYEPEKK